MLTAPQGAGPAQRLRAASFVLAGSKILDVACGSGGNLASLASRGQYTGCDVSTGGLARIKTPGSFLVCGDAEALPFAAQCFDAAVCTFALEHSADPVAMLNEMCRVVKQGGTIVLLGPSWDLPFWYPNSLKSKSTSWWWRISYTSHRLLHQLWATVSGTMPFEIVENPDAFSYPFIYDADAVYVVWTYEVIHKMRSWGCRLIHWEVDDRLLGSNPLVRLLKRLVMLLPQYRRAGSTVLLVFER